MMEKPHTLAGIQIPLRSYFLSHSEPHCLVEKHFCTALQKVMHDLSGFAGKILNFSVHQEYFWHNSWLYVVKRKATTYSHVQEFSEAFLLFFLCKN